MENNIGPSGRKRGPTRHSVEDQALDQIAKEKLVNLGGGKPTKDEEFNEDTDLRSPSPSATEPSTHNSQVVNNKTGKRSRKKGKNKKKTSEETKSEKQDESDDSESDKKITHEIPTEFYDDLSETDKSKNDSSTSQDVSSSDLSEDIAASNFSVQEGDEKDINESPKEVVDFDEFWAEFDKDEVKPRKSIVPEIDNESNEVNKDFGPPQDRNEDKSLKQVVNGKNASIESSASLMSKETEEEPQKELQNTEIRDNKKDADSDEIDFWGPNATDDKPKLHVSSLKTVDDQKVEEDTDVRSLEPSIDSTNIHKDENSDKEESISDFWGAGGDDENNKEAKENCLVREVDSDKKEVSDFWGDEGDDENAKKAKENSLLVRDADSDKEESISDFWSDRSDDKDMKKIEESSLVGDTTPQSEENITDTKAEMDLNDSSGNSEDIQSEMIHKSATEPEETNESHFSGDSPDTSEAKENVDTLQDLETNLMEEKTCDETYSEENTNDLVTSTDNFWDDAEDDGLPPVFVIRKSIDETSLIDSESLDPTMKTEVEGAVLEDETVRTSSSDPSDDVTEGNNTGDIQTSQEITQVANSTDDSTITGSTEDGSAQSSEKSKKPEAPVQIEENPSEEFEDSEKQAGVKEIHRRSFINVLKDIEAPTARRRASAVLPDNRERAVQAERQERASTRPSESSTDEASEDDGIMDFLGKENDRAEARLAARRQARVEAREIRMRELERVQREQEENSDRVIDFHNTPRQSAASPRTNSYHSSRRSSEDSVEDGLNLRDIRHELKEVEEKFRKAMVANAQLDNEKAALTFQVELFKDKLEDLEEAHAQLGREHREKCREHESLKRVVVKLKEELNLFRQCLEERDQLITDYGLVIVGGDVDEKGEIIPRALVSNKSAEILESAGEGSLDVRLKVLAKEKNELLDETRHLKLELEEERNRRRNEKMLSNGPIGDELQQTLNDYRFRLQKAEQDTSTLQATVARLESQVIRYKSAAEASEKAEDELKIEKRKLQREHRESIARIEELETANSHLQRRMDKLKNAKSTLLKEL